MISDHKKLAFESDIGHKAKVERENLKNPATMYANKTLNEMGNALKPEDGLDYLGTGAVHVYLKKGTFKDELIFMTQTDTMLTEQSHIADKAMLALTKDMQFRYTGKRQTNRSGF